MFEILINTVAILIAIFAIICCFATVAQIILEMYERDNDR